MKVIFICTGNTCRSPMAEALAKEIVRKKGLNIEVGSAGVSAVTGESVSNNALKVLKEIGIDASQKRSKNLLLLDDLDDIDIFAVMSNSHKMVLESIGIDKNKIYVLGGGIDDPYGGDENIYRRTRDQIQDALIKMFREKLKDGKQN